MTHASEGEGSARARTLRNLRLATRGALWLERASASLWPAIAILGGFLCAALLGLPQTFPGVLHLALLLVVIGGLAWALARARAGLGWPEEAAADRRLERAAGLAHRPLAVLSDRPSESGGELLWGPHRARALSQIGFLRLGWPRSTFPARDPRALRLLLLLGLTISVVVAGPDASERLLRAVTPHFAPAVVAPPLEIRAWVAPPAFTGLPPSVLPESGAVTIPAGSRLTLSLSGGSGGVPTLDTPNSSPGKLAFESIGTNSFQAQAEPAADGPLKVVRDGAEIGRWDITLRPDMAPVVTWSRPPAALAGRLPRVRLAWKATHEYGVASLGAEFRLHDRPAAAPLIVAIPLTGKPREAAGTFSTDLTAHPWAGLKVTATLNGRDGAGLAGTSDPAELVLPARKFRQPAAQAIIVVRQKLAIAPQNGTAAASLLRETAGRAEIWPEGDPGPLEARAVASLLDGTPADAVVDAAQSRLWALALRLEEDTTQRTAEALRKTQQELRSALDPAAPTETREKAEIDRRAEALAKALQRHQQALEQQARRDPGSVTPASPQDRAAADKTLQQLRDAARSDRMDEAREKMAELDQMLGDMRRASRGEAQRKRDEARQKGKAQVSAVQDLTRREGGQIDQAEARLADSSAADQTPARQHDRAVQLALRRALGELMQQHGDLTGSVPKNLGEADAAMREVAGALADGRDDMASAAALRAVEALQQGGQEMSQQLSKQFGSARNGRPGEDGQAGEGDGQQGDEGQQFAGNGQNGEQPGEGQGEANNGDSAGEGDTPGDLPGRNGRSVSRNRDPLGRATREGLMGTDGGRDTRVPEEMEQARGRAVQDELRRREAQRSRPQQELDYIGRLLRPE